MFQYKVEMVVIKTVDLFEPTPICATSAKRKPKHLSTTYQQTPKLMCVCAVLNRYPPRRPCVSQMQKDTGRVRKEKLHVA